MLTTSENTQRTLKVGNISKSRKNVNQRNYKIWFLTEKRYLNNFSNKLLY